MNKYLYIVLKFYKLKSTRKNASQSHLGTERNNGKLNTGNISF